MRALKKRLKGVAWLLSVLMLFQSCVVYHKTTTSLERASQLQTKTKVTQTNGNTSKFKYITYEEGVFYGVTKRSGELVKTPLDEEYIEKVLTKNKKASTWLTAVAIGIPVSFFLLGIILLETEGLDYDIGPEIIP